MHRLRVAVSITGFKLDGPTTNRAERRDGRGLGHVRTLHRSQAIFPVPTALMIPVALLTKSIAMSRQQALPSWLLVGSTDDLFGIALSGMQLEPSDGAAERTVGGKIRKGRQVSALNICALLHPTRVVLNVPSHLRPAACEVSCLCLPRSHCNYISDVLPTFKPQQDTVSGKSLGVSSGGCFSLRASCRCAPKVFELCDLRDTAVRSDWFS